MTAVAALWNLLGWAMILVSLPPNGKASAPEWSSDVERGRGGGGYGSCMKLLRVFMVDGWRPRRLQSVDLCLFKLFSTKKLLKKGAGEERKVEQNKSNSNISKHLPSPSSGSPAFAFAFAFAPPQLDSIKCTPPRCHPSLPPITVDCPGQPFDSRQPLG